MERPITSERLSRAGSSQRGSRRHRAHPSTSGPMGLALDGGKSRPRRSRLVPSLTGLMALGVVTAGFVWVTSLRHARIDRSPGQLVEDFELREVISGRPHRLSQHRGRVLVVVFVGTSCPVGELYLGRLAVLATEYRSRNVDFLAINSNASETISDVAQHARESRLNFPVLKDPENRVADQLLADARVRPSCSTERGDSVTVVPSMTSMDGAHGARSPRTTISWTRSRPCSNGERFLRKSPRWWVARSMHGTDQEQELEGKATPRYPESTSGPGNRQRGCFGRGHVREGGTDPPRSLYALPPTDSGRTFLASDFRSSPALGGLDRRGRWRGSYAAVACRPSIRPFR